MPDDIIHMRESQFRLLELLATIHRDGGHHTVKHGIEQSFRDAMKVIYEDRELNDVLGRAVMLVSQAIGTQKSATVQLTEVVAMKVLDAYDALRQAAEREEERRKDGPGGDLPSEEL